MGQLKNEVLLDNTESKTTLNKTEPDQRTPQFSHINSIAP
jgi:hypothetical protein